MLAEAELLQTVDVPVPARPLTPEQVQAATDSPSSGSRTIPGHLATGRPGSEVCAFGTLCRCGPSAQF